MTSKLKRIASSVLALSILVSLSGCKNNKKEENSITVIEDFTPAPEETPNDNHDLNEQVLADLVKYIDDFQTYYDYANLYPTEEDVLYVSNLSGNNYHHEPLKELKSEIKRVVESIKANSQKEYENPMLKSTFEYIVEKDGKREFYSIDLYEILTEALESTFLNATNDVAEDLCVLEDVTLVVDYGVYDNNVAMGYKSSENTITIYFNTIMNNLKQLPTKDNDEELKHVLFVDLSHEISHSRQDVCKHYEKSEADSMNLNKITSYATYVESSAESSLYSLDINPDGEGHFNYSYITEREQEALWLLMGVTNPNIDSYYNAIFDANINAFYDFFGLETLNDKMTFHKILYAIDSLNGRTSFIALATGSNKISIEELEKLVGYDYRTDIFKLSLKKLAKYTYDHPEFSFEENILLFSIMKTMVSENTYSYYYASEENTTCDLGMANDLSSLIRSYHDFLISTYNKRLIDIDDTEKDTSRKIDFLIYLAAGVEPNQYSEEDKETMQNCQKMLDKFPVLKTILFSKPFLFYDNYSLLEAAKEVEVKRVLAK